jgi:hypothetical protein
MSECELKGAFDKVFRQGQESERLKIQIKIVKKQTAYIKSGMVGGSCGLAWLIDELKVDKYD